MQTANQLNYTLIVERGAGSTDRGAACVLADLVRRAPVPVRGRVWLRRARPVCTVRHPARALEVHGLCGRGGPESRHMLSGVCLLRCIDWKCTCLRQCGELSGGWRPLSGTVDIISTCLVSRPRLTCTIHYIVIIMKLCI